MGVKVFPALCMGSLGVQAISTGFATVDAADYPLSFAFPAMTILVEMLTSILGGRLWACGQGVVCIPQRHCHPSYTFPEAGGAGSMQSCHISFKAGVP